MKSIAIIGTGIAGMAAGYFLKDKFDITFYEKNDYAGGHTNTITVLEGQKSIFIDTGFMVYNEITYPHLTRFLKELNIPTVPTTMSFGVQHRPSGLEYCTTGLNGLFGQRKNIFNLGFWRMLFEIRRFNREAPEVLKPQVGEKYQFYTVADYVREKKYSSDFLTKYLVPLSSCLWLAGQEKMLEFPIVTLVRFLKDQGFLGQAHQWRTIADGSKVYRDRVFSFFLTDNVFLNNRATEVIREYGKVAVFDFKGLRKVYDKVIFACHADQALSLLGDGATPAERWLLKEFQYQHNHAVLHTDPSVMPATRRVWSSWNYRIQFDRNGHAVPTMIYNMNSLQKVSQLRNYFISINDPGNIDPAQILWQAEYEHPLFSLGAIKAQVELPKLNQEGPVYFCGSYFNYGFHEDAFNSGLDVARAISGEALWG